ncbi:MAG: hypothetical protein WA971_08955 [Microbacterium sp.]
MTRAESRAVTVTRTGDLLRITPAGDTAPDLLTSALDLPGGILIFDIRAPEAPPAARVDDADTAAGWVERVFGPEVSAAFAARAEDEDDESTETSLPASSTDDGTRLARLALGQWLWRYWPDTAEVRGLNTALLRIELAALAWEADDAFGPLQPAGMLLNGQLEKLEQAAEALRSGIRTDPGILDTPLGRAVRGAVDALVAGDAGPAAGASDELLDRLDSVLDAVVQAESGRAGGSEGPVTEPEEWLAGLVSEASAARREDFALAAGLPDDDSADTRSGRASVDWSQVPPRILDWREDTVQWTAVREGPGSWRVRVQVPSIPDIVVEGLHARCYVPGESPETMLPVAVVPLKESFGVHLGEFVLRADDPEGLVVDVYEASTLHAPRVTGESRRAGADDRAQARRIIAERAESPVQAGAAAVFEAERHP